MEFEITTKLLCIAENIHMKKIFCFKVLELWVKQVSKNKIPTVCKILSHRNNHNNVQYSAALKYLSSEKSFMTSLSAFSNKPKFYDLRSNLP
ncbi:Hypothetical predicted protein [Octopus vulgaris]|uniref:Uncharacterized protein n=1 Tax=Octopus vulgaris TaxID=6645 RepID=A0AA36APJ4_OCTVU|nr:Hypothetical predicted protein [Octopus vulgaris]